MLKSRASALAVIAGAATGQAADNDIVTIDTDATIRADDAANDSLFCCKAMSNSTANLIINDSTLLGDIVNTASMIATTGTTLRIINDSQIFGQISNTGLISANNAGIAVNDAEGAFRRRAHPGLGALSGL